MDEEAIGGLLTDYTNLTDEQRQVGEKALLDIKVCDPAAGSGHFLVVANDALAGELARIRARDEYPTEAQVQAARRDVLAHCIYAVDLNPMAVELCKVSLWINACMSDRPLSFLDHHIKCGNSLIGTMPQLMAEGVPYQAFDQKMVGNDRATTNAIRKRNRQEADGQLPMGWRVTIIVTPEDLARWRQLSRLAQDQPQAAREHYARYRQATDYLRRKLEADFWTASFFWPLPKGTEWAPTHGEFLRLLAEGPEALPPEVLDQIDALARHYRFFHWHLEFPDVFDDDGQGGFDLVLGNPPWERVKLQEKEFFAERDEEVATAPNAAARRRLIRRLEESNPVLWAEYRAALRDAEATSHFLHGSGRFPLTGRGDVNTYQVFAGLARALIAPDGRAGIVVPTGITTDYTNREFFADLVGHEQLASLYDFENRRGLFPASHRSYKFSLLTLRGSASEERAAEFAFFLHDVDDLAAPERRFILTAADFSLLNPNTHTCPVFRTRRDPELTRKLYRAAPVLHNRQTGENPWGASFFTMFHMTNDSHLFRTREQLEAQGFVLEGNRFLRGEEVYLPLYEAKMIEQYDHRFAGVTHHGKRARTGEPEETTIEEHSSPIYVPTFRYWVKHAEVSGIVRHERGISAFVAYKDITTASSERTLKVAVLPYAAVGNSAPIIDCAQSTHVAGRLCLLSNLNSCVVDYIARQKVGYLHINFFTFEQFPIIRPQRHTPSLLAFIAPRVLELTYTAWDLRPFADDVWREAGGALRQRIVAQWEANAAETGGHLGAQPPEWVELAEDGPSADSGQAFPYPPFKWDEGRRARLRAELDGLYAHLYGLTREELDYILETFPIVKRKDEKRYGEYRTKRMVLEAYDRLSEVKV